MRRTVNRCNIGTRYIVGANKTDTR
jgi:hypothetical protein